MHIVWPTFSKGTLQSGRAHAKLSFDERCIWVPVPCESEVPVGALHDPWQFAKYGNNGNTDCISLSLCHSAMHTLVTLLLAVLLAFSLEHCNEPWSASCLSATHLKGQQSVDCVPWYSRLRSVVLEMSRYISRWCSILETCWKLSETQDWNISKYQRQILFNLESCMTSLLLKFAACRLAIEHLHTEQ